VIHPSNSFFFVCVQKAVYELERLVIEGHSFETNTGITPRGLQLILGTPASQDAVDTIVMWNYGYFQLQVQARLKVFYTLTENI